MTAIRWRIDPDGAPVLSLPCGHDVLVKPSWIARDGRFVGRLACTTCRRVYDDAQLVGWVAPGSAT